MKRLTALALVLGLTLTGCAAMLERDYLVSEPHAENPPGQSESFYRVETYSGLFASLCSYVEEGMESGALRFPTTYAGNLTVDLEKAKRQLMEETPLGCYALSDVTFHVSRIIAYYEVTASFDYRIPPAEYTGIPHLSDADALDKQMEAALTGFDNGFTCLLELSAAPEQALADSLLKVYDRCPQAALGRPELEVTCYPENSTQAVAEVHLTYPESPYLLRARQRELLRIAQLFAEEHLAEADGSDCAAVYRTVMAQFQYDPEGGSTTDAAFFSGSANDEGLARAYLLLCRLKDNKDAGIGEGPDGWQSTDGLPEDGAAPLIFRPDGAPSQAQTHVPEGGETP